MSSENNLASIVDREQAEDAWEGFFGRFYSNEIPLGVKVEFDPSVREFKPRENKHAKNYRPFKEEEGKEEVRTDHSDDFDDFLNGKTVKIPESVILDEITLNEVEAAISNGDFSADIFKKIDHIYYALWLFKQDKITRQQMSTILATWQVSSLVENNQRFKILDEEGNFTPEAIGILIPIINANSYHGELTPEQLERFRLLIMTAPPSEQLFHIADPIEGLVRKNNLKQLGAALQKNKAWYRVNLDKESSKDIHLSFGTMDALQIAIHGVHGAAAARTVLGKVGINAVKEGVEYYYRPTAIDIPQSGVVPTTKGIHGYAETPMPVVTAHDIFHTRLHNTIPPEFHLMLNHMTQIISKHTHQNWSKLLWELVDREYHSFQRKPVQLSADNGAENFVNLFAYAKSRRSKLLHGNELTEEVIAIVYDMVKNKDVWKKMFKVNIDDLSQPYDFYIQKMQQFIKLHKNDKSNEIFNFKFRCFCTAENTEEYQYMCHLIDDESLIKQLQFVKLKAEPNKNHTILEYTDSAGNKLEVKNANMEQIFSPLIKKKFANGNELDVTALNRELSVLLSKFKSFGWFGNEVSEELLDASLKKFPSLEEKLFLLESCHYEVMLAKNYSRRNPNWDQFFSFMRNPLTDSQQKHQSQILYKVTEVIEEHVKDMSFKEKNEFMWGLEKRNSKSNIYEDILAHNRGYYVNYDFM